MKVSVNAISTKFLEMEYKYAVRYNFRKMNVNNGMLLCLGFINWDEMLNFKVLGFNNTVGVLSTPLQGYIKL